MGPKSRYLGEEAPSEDLIWQDPLPAVSGDMIDDTDIKELKHKLLTSGLTISELVYTAWSSASTFRGSDFRGGANGARIRLAPQRSWEVNQPAQLERVLATLEAIQEEFNQADGNKVVSIADLIVLGGNAAIEKAALEAGTNVEVPFTAGRVDAMASQTDETSFNVLEPVVDGFRNYAQKAYSVSEEDLLLDKSSTANTNSARNDCFDWWFACSRRKLRQ